MVDRILVIDDDDSIRELLRRLLTHLGYEVRTLASAHDLEAVLEEFHPHLLLCDVMMPGRDGLAVCASLRANPTTRELPIVLITAKLFDDDRRAAQEAGASAYLVKPFNAQELIRVVHEQLRLHAVVTVWGARGSIAAPEHGQGRYGGNTSCLSVALPGQRHVVFDAGTGIRRLGHQISESEPAQIALCLTHFHWDHIFGLPFFTPLYRPENEVHLCGPAESHTALIDKIHVEMGGDYFPVSVEAFRARMHYQGLSEQKFEVLGLNLATMYTLHPRRTLAYRLEWEGRSLVYAPDNELMPASTHPEVTGEAARLAEFARGASLLIHDCTYSAATYERHRGWGHSSPLPLAALAAAAGVERVLLFHHDPDSNDEDVEAIHAEFRNALPASARERIHSEPAREGTCYRL